MRAQSVYCTQCVNAKQRMYAVNVLEACSVCSYVRHARNAMQRRKFMQYGISYTMHAIECKAYACKAGHVSRGLTKWPTQNRTEKHRRSRSGARGLSSAQNRMARAWCHATRVDVAADHGNVQVNGRLRRFGRPRRSPTRCRSSGSSSSPSSCSRAARCSRGHRWLSGHGAIFAVKAIMVCARHECAVAAPTHRRNARSAGRVPRLDRVGRRERLVGPTARRRPRV